MLYLKTNFHNMFGTTHFNTVVSNHFHSVKNFLFSSAKPCDFDGLLGTGLLVSMYTTPTPTDKWCFNVTQLKEFFLFSVKDRYHFFLYLLHAVSIMKGKRPVLIYFCYQTD